MVSVAGRAVLPCRALRIRVGHSPDPDDAFMYWALTTDLVDTRGHDFEQVLGEFVRTIQPGIEGAGP